MLHAYKQEGLGDEVTCMRDVALDRPSTGYRQATKVIPIDF